LWRVAQAFDLGGVDLLFHIVVAIAIELGSRHGDGRRRLDDMREAQFRVESPARIA
jgi:hypothetical protein